MATRIDKTVNSLNLNSYNLISHLRRRAGRKSNVINYVGAVRNNALADLTDSGAALSNVLQYITRVTDAREISLYGQYSNDDFNLTREFIANEIDKEFLLPLKDVSVTDEGSEISINPRLRIEDRLKSVDGLAGRGAFDNLHKGPTAIFYKVKTGDFTDVGTLAFTGGFNNSTGALSNPTAAGAALPTSGKYAYLLTEYTNPNNSGETLSLAGSGVYVLVDFDATPNPAWTLGDAYSILRMKSIQSTFSTSFNSIAFKLEREYSLLNIPSWYTTSPGAGAAVTGAGGPDDIDPETTYAILDYERGLSRLYIEDEYFSTGNYVAYRIPDDDRSSYNGNNIVKDSNMRFDKPPRVLLDNQTNWGVRWDGYLRLDTGDNARKYVFEVQTNVALRVDLVTGGTDASPTWTEVINTADDTKSASFLSAGDQGENGQKYFSKNSFTLGSLPPKFRYYTNIDGTSSKRYVPISIRMWYGATDKVDLSTIQADQPNIFLKTGFTETNAGTQSKFYSQELVVNVATAGGNTTITGHDGSGSIINESVTEVGSATRYDLLAYIATVTAPGFEYNAINNGSGLTEGLYEGVQFEYVKDTGGGSAPDLNPSFNVEVSAAGTISNIELASAGEGVSEDSEFEYTGNILGDNGNGSDPRVRYEFNPAISKDVEVLLEPPIRVYLQHATPGNPSTALRAYSDAAFTTATTLPSPPGNTSYKLRAIPNRDDYSPSLDTSWNSSLLWSTRMVGPKRGYNGYADLLNVSGTTYEPSIFKFPFDEKPDYWKAREGKRYLFYDGSSAVPITTSNDPIDGWESNFFKSSLQSNAFQKGLYGDGSNNYSTRKNLILGEAKFNAGDKNSSNYIGIRLTKNDLGEGGLFKFTGLPINNALANYVGETENKNKILDENDLGGTPNHQTIVGTKTVNSKTIRFYWKGGLTLDPATDPEAGKFYLHSDLTSVSGPDDPTSNANGNYPAFDQPEWNSQIGAFAVSRSTSAGGANKQGFAGVIPLSVERIKFNTSTNTFPDQDTPLGANEVYLLAFSTGVEGANANAPAGRSTDTDFSGGLGGEFIEFYKEEDLSFQFKNVDTGKSISFSDVVKITYTGGGSAVEAGNSEVPKPKSSMMTPFGDDNKANYTSGLCYPPYSTVDSALKPTAVTDATLYAAAASDFDVYWGDETTSSPPLGGNKLYVTEKIEFSYPSNLNESDVVESYTPSATTSLTSSDYTHRYQVNLPLSGSIPDDATEHIGNLEKVKNAFFLYVNGETAVGSGTKMPGLP